MSKRKMIGTEDGGRSGQKRAATKKQKNSDKLPTPILNPLRACAKMSGDPAAGYRDASKFPTVTAMLNSDPRFIWCARGASPCMNGDPKGPAIPESRWANKAAKVDSERLKAFKVKGLKGAARTAMLEARKKMEFQLYVEAVTAFEQSLTAADKLDIKRDLVGRIPVCWCSPHMACHCDILVKIRDEP